MHRHPASEDRPLDSTDPHYFGNILQARLTRRQALLGGMSAATTAVLGGLSGCMHGSEPIAGTFPGGAPIIPELQLGFSAVAKSLEDVVTVPAGYSARVLYALGDPIASAVAAYSGNGTESGSSYERRAGDHHDGMHYFGITAGGAPDPVNSSRGLLCINHENITQPFLHANGPTADAEGNRTVADEVLKEMNVHGVSIVEVARSGSGPFAVVTGSPYNHRITARTSMELSGPLRGSRYAITRHSTDGTRSRGTVNNCAHGYTPWGTYLTCEENWAGYFKRADGDDASSLRSAPDLAALKRYGVAQGNPGNYGWSTLAGDEFERWNATISGTSSDGSDDYRNEPNTFGWIVEIDPYNGTSTPRKRSALGRFAHEGCWPALVKTGQPVVFYMGDDGRGEYIYKWVSAAVYDAADTGLAAGDKYLDTGTLYVARFNSDGTGNWIALAQGSNGLDAANASYPFDTQAAVCVNTRLAADSVGATRMDRPEWAAVNPTNGEVYLTLTNNSNRGNNASQPVNAANPRNYSDMKNGVEQKGNVNGHIIRWREDADRADAVSFRWDIFLFGAQADANRDSVNLSLLDDSNDFSSADGLWFDNNGLLWIQTDDPAYTDVTNCMMLVAVPGRLGDSGGSTQIGSITTYKGRDPGDRLRRFLVGPKQSEITGIIGTPDMRALFVNIQHPGEDGSFDDFVSHWPNAGGDATQPGATSARPRSATIVITKDDGGVIGL